MHATTHEALAKLFLNCTLRTRLDLLKRDSQMKRALSSEKGREKEFQIGQSVIARDYRTKNKWVPGVITDCTGPLMYKVDIGSNELWRRHADQIRESNLSSLPEPQQETVQTQIAPNMQPVVEPQIELE